MTRIESRTLPAPSYRNESVLGKLQALIVKPVSEAAAPVTSVLKPVGIPLARLGHEAYTSFTHEGEVRRKAQFIEVLQRRFQSDEKSGAELLEQSLALLDQIDRPNKGEEGEDTSVSDMGDLLFNIQGWLPEIYLGDAWMNPDKDSFRSLTKDLMAGYLFHKNAQLFEAEEKVLDTDKQQRQMKGVAAMLLGHHAHMGTGEGKSTVVLPIVSLIEARTSLKKDVFLSAASEASLDELQEHVSRLEAVLPSHSRCSLGRYQYDNEPTPEESNTMKQIQFEMQREVVLHGRYSEKLKKQLRDIFWKERMKGNMLPARVEMVTNKEGGSRVLFVTERDMVFAFEENPERFLNDAPAIVMDEADIPYRRQTPYVTTTEAQYYSPEEIEGSMGEWLLHYIIGDRVNFPTVADSGDFIPTQNGFDLKDEARSRLSSLNLHHFLDSWSSHSAAKRAFKRGVRIIAQELHISDPSELRQFEMRMRKWMKDNLPSSVLEPQEDGVQASEDERETEMQSLVYATAERLGTLYYEKGISYLAEKGSSEVKIRDAYIDDLLEGHRHQSQTQTAILAMNGRYSFVPPYRTAGRSVHFQTFLSSLKDRIRCASGSLLFPDLIDGKIKKESFGLFLEQATGKKIILITPPDIKKAPVPVFSRSHTEATERFVVDVSAREQPRLVICYDRLEGASLLELLQTRNPSKKIVYVPIHPTAREVGAYCRDLAEGKIDILISAGNLGFGVNIVKSNGEYPDLHVALYGLPENQLQAVQAFGRRRKEGSDFSWYVSEPEVFSYVGGFKAETSWRERVIKGILSVEQMLQGYEEVMQAPEKGLAFVADLLQQHEFGRRADDSFVTYFDQGMDEVRQYAFRRLYKLIRMSISSSGANAASEQMTKVLSALEDRSNGIRHGQLVRSIDSQKRSKWISGHIDMVASLYGLPDELDEDMRHELAVSGASFHAQNVKDLIENKFMSHLFSRGFGSHESKIDQYIDGWFRLRSSGMEEMIRVLSDGFSLERMFPIILSSAREDMIRLGSTEPADKIDEDLNRVFIPLSLHAPVEGMPPEGITLGLFHIGPYQILGMKNGNDLQFVHSFQSGTNIFSLENGKIYERVGIMPLSSPIGIHGSEPKDMFVLWTSHKVG